MRPRSVCLLTALLPLHLQPVGKHVRVLAAQACWFAVRDAAHQGTVLPPGLYDALAATRFESESFVHFV